MTECKLNHSEDDVAAKLVEQSDYLPLDIQEAFRTFLSNTPSQPELNIAFHLLKKYDLATIDERKERHPKMYELLNT
ncbi:group-specific protein [Bacillus solitudinis]|uniref:group-specific protein n=1 Tax=Bacillus solitudinis TaxID=2014074 RepID=UPI000C2446C0|nr:group-specific protein [Bacillus solitudinis]